MQKIFNLIRNQMDDYIEKYFFIFLTINYKIDNGYTFL